MPRSEDLCVEGCATAWTGMELEWTGMEPEWTGMQGAGKGEGWSRSRGFPCQTRELGLYSLDQWSPNFLAPRTIFLEDSFSVDWG